MATLTPAEHKALLHQQRHGGELRVEEEGRSRPRRLRRAPETMQQLQEQEDAKKKPARKRQRDGRRAQKKKASKKKMREAERAKSELPRNWGTSMYDRGFEEILDHNVCDKKLRLLWDNGAKTWEEPHAVAGTSSDCDIVLQCLREQKDETQQMKEWIKEVENLQSAAKMQEKEDNRTPEKHELAFCCAICKCSEDVKVKREFQGFVSSGETSLWHRRCCHKVPNKTKMRWSRVDIAHEEMWDTVARNEETILVCGPGELRKKAREAERLENLIQNQLEEESPVDLLRTNPAHDEFRQIYDQYVGKLGEAVVLDMFAGVGTGLVALKRLGIAMKTVIHVDHDMVARHVDRCNHDKSYNRHLEHDDEIDHIFKHSSFENVEDNLDEIMENYGPIDIVIGGPPCQDYSLVNKDRQGVEGEGGKYFPNFGKLIQKIKTHKEQQCRHVFFLAENVPVKGFENADKVEQAFGITPLTIDAHVLSPCKRFRGYYINFPPDDIKFESLDACSSALSCLEPGWTLASIAMREATLSEPILSKANTFMASRGRIDDQRMLKVKELGDGSFAAGFYSVLERERMLGYPEHYVETAVNVLFDELSKALSVRLLDEDTWCQTLDEKYHCFSGEKFAFEKCTREKPSLEPKLTPPTNTNDFFNREHYAKHLLGNAYSIPVVEHLLKPLAKVFQRRAYSGYDYQFSWPREALTNLHPDEEESHSDDGVAGENAGCADPMEQETDSDGLDVEPESADADRSKEASQVRVKTKYF